MIELFADWKAKHTLTNMPGCFVTVVQRWIFSQCKGNLINLLFFNNKWHSRNIAVKCLKLLFNSESYWKVRWLASRFVKLNANVVIAPQTISQRSLFWNNNVLCFPKATFFLTIKYFYLQIMLPRQTLRLLQYFNEKEMTLQIKKRAILANSEIF
jgi:hypothetical protein